MENTTERSFVEIQNDAIAVLKTVYDPEIPVDIYELGLIYEIKVSPSGMLTVMMTLTSPSCPVAGTLPGEVEAKLKGIAGVQDVKVELTFDPPWSQDLMSEEAKLELGFL
jgi:FeS assembly SUF system protein